MVEKLRLIADLIFEDTPATRAFLRNVWDTLKNNKDRFSRLNLNEDSYISIHLCPHELAQVEECQEIRKITMNTITKEDPI